MKSWIVLFLTTALAWAATPTKWYADADDDTFGTGTVYFSRATCEAGSGYTCTKKRNDCNDSDASIHPGAREIWYDGVDQNCDRRSDYDADRDGQDSNAYGGTDCNDSNPYYYYTADPRVATSGMVGDFNCDGVPDTQDTDGDGYVSWFGGAPTIWDCDDSNSAIHYGAEETEGDGIDSNCDGLDGVDHCPGETGEEPDSGGMYPCDRSE